MWHFVSGDNGCENSKNCESGIFLALKKLTADHACFLLSSSPIVSATPDESEKEETTGNRHFTNSYLHLLFQ
jgi:hypothetical protein